MFGRMKRSSGVAKMNRCEDQIIDVDDGSRRWCNEAAVLMNFTLIMISRSPQDELCE